ncbi:MAG TPA: porin [Geminicoccaceae bacterium]|nr:porin [Geminicoccaceae bacterium]
MHHRLLMGSTALVGASILFAGATPAQAEIEVVLSGYTEFGGKAATDETLQSSPDRGYTFFMDNEVHIEATGVSDGGMTYGSYLELEVGSGDATQTNAFVDEVNLFFSGGFGRVELGQQDGAEDVMFVGGEDAQAGTGGIDGDTANLTSVINLRNTSDATKATYFTPRVGGFQLGASYIPDTGSDGGGDNTPGDSENNFGGGVNWVGAFGGIDLTLSAVGIIGDGETDDTDDRRDYVVGGLLGVGGLSFGASWGQLLDEGEADFVQLGLKYGFGAANASVGYMYVDEDDLADEQHLFVVSGDVGLAPGLTLKGDVSYNSDDPGNDDSDGADQDDTIAGVVSVQLDY